MISAGVEGRLPYMTYPDPYRGPPKQPPEFLRPAPKPLPSARYNGLHGSPQNGTRLVPPQRTTAKYPSPPTVAPVNLTQHKEDIAEELTSYYTRLLNPVHSHFPHFTPGPYSNLYPPHYTPIVRHAFPHPPPLSPLETYSPTVPNTTTFLSPPSTFSPPAAVKPLSQQSVVRDKRTQQQQQQQQFKVPSGKEGSLKHRILTRPEDNASRQAVDQHRVGEVQVRGRITPPLSPKRTLNNNTVPGNFAKGSLIQLANGELRRVEDMRTEDFVVSAQQSPELRLADSTVVRIKENSVAGTATITLSYNKRRTQVEVETTLEHPYFVYGQGWASCNPDRTIQCYGLKVHSLQVGDVLISLTPREQTVSVPRSTTIITTATTTAVTARQQTVPSSNGQQLFPQTSLSPESHASRKRRWSAPDETRTVDKDEQMHRKH